MASRVGRGDCDPGGRAERSLRFLPEWTIPGVVLYLTATLYFYLPLSMPFRYPIHKFVDPASRWSFLFYPETWTVLLLFFLAVGGAGRTAWRRIGSDRSFLALLLCAGGYVLVAVISSILQQSDPDFYVRKVTMEWVLPITLGVTLRVFWTKRLDREILRALIFGSFIILCVGIITYLTSFGIPGSFLEHVFQNRSYLIWRGMEGGVSFGEIPMGGVNVLAGYTATITCLVFANLLLTDRTPRRLYLLLWIVLAAVVELLCFSRGALLFIYGLVPALALTSRGFRRSRWFHGAAGIVVLLLLASVFPKDAYQYWRGQLTFEQGSSASSRLRQLQTLLSVEKISGEEVPDFARRGIDKYLADRRREEEGREAAEPEPVPVAEASGGDAGGRDVSGSAPLDAGSPPTTDSGKPEEPAAAAGPVPTGSTERPSETAPSVAPARAGAKSAEAMSVRDKIGGPRRRLWLGYGLGHYGVLRGLVPDSGTHNIVLNALVDCGVVGAALFVAFLVIAVWRRFMGWRLSAGTEEQTLQLCKLAALGSILFIGLLVDYRLENLGTMTGAATLWYLVTSPVGARGREEVR